MKWDKRGIITDFPITAWVENGTQEIGNGGNGFSRVKNAQKKRSRDVELVTIPGFSFEPKSLILYVRPREKDRLMSHFLSG